MEIVNLYKYEREGGGITVSPIKPAPDTEYTQMYRIIASDSMLVTQDGTNTYSVVDTESKENWYEIKDMNRQEESK